MFFHSSIIESNGLLSLFKWHICHEESCIRQSFHEVETDLLFLWEAWNGTFMPARKISKSVKGISKLFRQIYADYCWRDFRNKHNKVKVTEIQGVNFFWKNIIWKIRSLCQHIIFWEYTDSTRTLRMFYRNIDKIF